MSDVLSNNKRIAKNTLMLYFRMLLTLVVGLYTSRVILQTLGVSDYGLYNVVGGIVTIFMFLNGTLTTGTQRFLSFSLGENNKKKMSEVFSTAFQLHLSFSIIFLVIAEIGGLWFINYKLQIPAGRETAAFWVYQFSIITSIMTIIIVPYRSSIIAHEKMDIYAYISIYEVVMKLILVYLIQVIDYDKLILFAFLGLLIQLSSSFFNIIYCHRHYEECRHIRSFDKSVFKEIATFSGWNIFGVTAVALQGQGVNMLLNMFLGTIVNAARGIAFQVNSIILQFVNNFQTAVNPQIVKYYAAGKKDEMIKLVINNSKFAGFLFLIIAVPLFVEIEFVLSVWLGDYPEYTVSFVRIILIQSLVQTLSRPVVMVVHAVGKMKAVNLTAGTSLLLILPISYLLLLNGVTPDTVFIVNIIPWIFETLFEVYYEKKYIGFPMWGFYKRVYLVVSPIALLLVSVPYLAHVYLPMEGWGRFLIVCIISVITSVVTIYYLGLSKHLREMVLEKAKSIVISKIHR